MEIIKDEFTVLGTVLSYTGKKGKLIVNDRNLAGDKRVMIKMINEAGEELRALLSTSLSADLRADKIRVGNLVTFEYGVNDLGRHYIVQPQGTEHTIEVESLNIEAIEVEDLDITSLITL